MEEEEEEERKNERRRKEKKALQGAPRLNLNSGQEILTMVHISSVFMHHCTTAGLSTFIHSMIFIS